VSASGVWLGSEKGVCGLESGLLIWVLCPFSGGILGGQGGGSGLGVEGMWGLGGGS
jgi:hypothetical protein